MLNQGIDGAQAYCQGTKLHAVHQFASRFDAADDTERHHAAKAAHLSLGDRKPRRKRTSKSAEPGRTEELERDLVYLKECYQASIEEQQASNEELKSSNEEMQSTNEELETSQEELQSVNEELITVNAELQNKIEQLAGMQNDMKNLLDSIHVGIIFLDQHLLIRRFTSDALRIYRLVDTDIGRSLNDIKSVVPADELLTAAQSVLESLITYEQELNIGVESWMLLRIQPYRTLENVIDGVVLTFTYITSRIKARATQEALYLAEGIVNTLREPFLVLDGALPGFLTSFLLRSRNAT